MAPAIAEWVLYLLTRAFVLECAFSLVRLAVAVGSASFCACNCIDGQFPAGAVGSAWFEALAHIDMEENCAVYLYGPPSNVKEDIQKVVLDILGRLGKTQTIPVAGFMSSLVCI